MFDEEKIAAEAAEKRSRTRILLALTAIAGAALLLLIGLLVTTQPSSSVAIEGIHRTGTAEFEGYRSQITLEMVETIVHPNLVGMAQHEVRGVITNQGPRPITALEIHARMIGLEDQTIVETLGYPIPRSRSKPLAPGEQFPFSLKLDRPGNVSEDLVKDHSLELRGLRF
ncbi:MAG: hypothetical protein ACOYNR_02005 [Blastocatellia bacterium]